MAVERKDSLNKVIYIILKTVLYEQSSGYFADLQKKNDGNASLSMLIKSMIGKMIEQYGLETFNEIQDRLFPNRKKRESIEDEGNLVENNLNAFMGTFRNFISGREPFKETKKIVINLIKQYITDCCRNNGIGPDSTIQLVSNTALNADFPAAFSDAWGKLMITIVHMQKQTQSGAALSLQQKNTKPATPINSKPWMSTFKAPPRVGDEPKRVASRESIIVKSKKLNEQELNASIEQARIRLIG